MSFESHRAAWMEVDIRALKHNYDLLCRSANVPVIAIVKADAYGHGAVPVAKALIEAGAPHLGVATVEELTELREAGITCPILILGFVDPLDYPQLIKEKGEVAIFSLDQAKALAEAARAMGCRADLQIKIDSGMNRVGFLCTEEAAEDILSISRMPELNLCGIFSHFCCADNLEEPYNRRQLDAFRGMVDLCRSKGVEFPLVHLGNSAAIMQLPEAHFDMMRGGIALYGTKPDASMDAMGLEPIMSVKARIVRIHTAEPGMGVSYGCTWRAERPSIIATLPLGYADGMPRLLSNKGHVLIGGKRAPIAGRVCMDQFMVDITDIVKDTEVNLYDEAVIMGVQGEECISADEVAAQAGTINYEILCHFGRRLPRKYINSSEE